MDQTPNQMPSPTPNRTPAIIATVATAFMCGCPGLMACSWGLFFGQVGGGFMGADPTTALFSNVGAIFIGIILVAIPVAVGFFTLRRKGMPNG